MQYMPFQRIFHSIYGKGTEMKQMEQIATRSLKPGMMTDSPILDQYGRALLEPGTILSSFIINGLLRKGITVVYIRRAQPKKEGEKREAPPSGARPNSAKARTAERLYRSDPARVEFTDSMREHILTGIQNIYHTPDPRELASTTSSIADVLLQAVEEHESMLVDISALKVSDEYTYKHSVDVATLSMVIGKKLGMTARELHELGAAGLLHDLGKIRIPDSILNKPSRLTPEEFEIIKKHPLYGFEMIKDNPDIPIASAVAVLQHHEKLNGTGYPYGISQSDIFPYSRILGVADVYDALATSRPYKNAKTPRECVEILMSMYEELDVEIMNAFIDSMLLYPVDTVVELSNGEYARVIAQGAHFKLRPTVLGLRSGTVYELEDPCFANLVIL